MPLGLLFFDLAMMEMMASILEIMYEEKYTSLRPTEINHERNERA